MSRLLAAALVITIGMLVAVAWSHALLQQPLAVTDGEVLEVRSGDNLQRVLRRLEDGGALRHARWVVRVARLSGRELTIKAGEYRLDQDMTASSLIELMVEGRVVLHAMTVVEGWTFRQLRRAIEAHPVLEQTLAGMDDLQVMEVLGFEGQHPEGRFFPDTYLFPRGTTDRQFLASAYRQMDAYLTSAWERRDGGLPYASPYEALIMASIVEREARLAEERGTIAGVFVRRLHLGMRLQTDPTVMYGVSPDFNDRLRRHHLRTDTPYNTYTRHGLPPTPIAMPGAGAIDAALAPEPGEVLYFVARGDGSHHFSETLEEHNRAVARYQLGRGDDGN